MRLPQTLEQEKSLQTLGLQALTVFLYFSNMVRPAGLEPAAHGLKVRYSTN